MVAFAIVLIVLAFVGGLALSYAILDAPRREYREKLARMKADWVALEENRSRLEAFHKSLEEQRRVFEGALAEFEARKNDLAFRTAEFDRRVISYDELSHENRRLKTDLKNIATHMAHQECVLSELRESYDGAFRSKSQLGRMYLDEALAAAKRGITSTNYMTYKQRITATLSRLRGAGVGLSQTEEQAALAQIYSLYEKAVQAAAEREEQARLRERIREEQRREREAQEAIELAEREQRAIELALERAMTDVAGRHAEEVERLRSQLAEAEAKTQRAISQAQITRAGSVYVISNLGSFGADIFKIGMTRRLEPLDRVDELGDASVPFPFDVHMMIKCDDAPKLESALHRRFHKRRVNKVNPRKEFFRVSVAEVVEAVREMHGEVEYQADAEALEFLQSQTMSDEDLAEVEQVFAKTEAASGLSEEE